MMKTNGKRNRNAGHAWELEGVKAFQSFYPGVATSRNVSRVRDAEKVDLAFTDELKMGRFPYNLQYKSYSKSIAYPVLLSEMPQDGPEINVIMHKQTERSGNRFVTRDRFAIMKYDDFFKFAAWRLGYELLMEIYGDELASDPMLESTRERFKQLGL